MTTGPHIDAERRPLPYGVPMRCDRCDPMLRRRDEKPAWCATFTAQGIYWTFGDLPQPMTPGLWYMATRLAGDQEDEARLMGGYSTPAALMEALAGQVVFAEATP